MGSPFDLLLRAGLDDKDIKRGFKDMIRQSGIFKGNMGALGSTIGLALGVSGGLGAVLAFRQGVKGMIDDLAATDRLVDTISKRTFFSGALKQQIDDITRSFRYMGVEDTKLTEGLDELISQSNDVAGSLKNVNLLVDVAAKLHGNWERASKLVAAAMAGQTEQLGELVPEIKNVVREMKVVPGTAEAVRLSFKALGDYAGGAQESETGTLRGALNSAGVALREFNEAWAEVLTGGSEKGGLAEKVIGGFTFWINAQTDALREDNKQLREWIGNRNKAMATTGQYMPERGRNPLPGISPILPSLGINRELERAVMAGLTNAQDVAMGRAPGASGAGGAMPNYPDPWELPMPDIVPRLPRRGLPDLSVLPFYMGRRGYGPKRGRYLDLVDMPAERQGTDNPVAKRLLEQDARMRQQWQEGIRSATETGLTLAIQGGNWAQAFKDIITQSLVSAFAEAFSKKLTNWLFSAAATAGGGPIAGGLSGIFNGIGDGNSSVRFAAMASARRAAARG